MEGTNTVQELTNHEALKMPVENNQKRSSVVGSQQGEDSKDTEMTKEQIEAALANVLSAVSEKRKGDMKIISEMCQQIVSHAEKCRDLLEKYMKYQHAIRCKELDVEVDTIKSFLEKSAAVHSDLERFKNSMNFFCRDIHYK